MSVSEFLPASQHPDGPTTSADPAIRALLTRLMARVVITLEAYLDADAALGRSAVALFGGRGITSPEGQTAAGPAESPPSPPWGSPAWLKPLQKSLAAPSPSLARLFLATFDRWLAQRPETAALRDLETRLALPRAATAILATILVLETPTTPAALASALADDEHPRRQLLSLMLPGGPLVDLSLVQNASPLSPILPHPSLFATSPTPSQWMAVVAAPSAGALPFLAPAAPGQPEIPTEDHEEEAELVAEMLGAIAKSCGAAITGLAPLAALDEALTLVTTLRARIPYGSLGPVALKGLLAVPHALICLALTLPDTRIVEGCLEFITHHPGAAWAPEARAIASELGGAASQAFGAGEVTRTLSLAALGRAFSARHRLADMECFFLGVQAEAEEASPAATATWTEVQRRAVQHPRLAPLKARADHQLLPAFGFFATRHEAP